MRVANDVTFSSDKTRFPHQTEIFSTDEKPSTMAQIQLKLICGNPSSTRGDCKGIIFSIRRGIVWKIKGKGLKIRI